MWLPSRNFEREASELTEEGICCYKGGPDTPCEGTGIDCWPNQGQFGLTWNYVNCQYSVESTEMYRSQLTFITGLGSPISAWES
jgi:hypothetical protein